MNPPNDQKTLRDEFAMAALVGMLANGQTDPTNHKLTPEFMSGAAYRFADAMIEQRKK